MLTPDLDHQGRRDHRGGTRGQVFALPSPSEKCQIPSASPTTEAGTLCRFDSTSNDRECPFSRARGAQQAEEKGQVTHIPRPWRRHLKSAPGQEMVDDVCSRCKRKSFGCSSGKRVFVFIRHLSNTEAVPTPEATPSGRNPKCLNTPRAARKHLEAP